MTAFGSSLHEWPQNRNIENMKEEYDFSQAKRGAVSGKPAKTRITIYLDDDVVAAYKNKGDEIGRGYQTLINDALRETIGRNAESLDVKTLRRILREELKKAG